MPFLSRPSAQHLGESLRLAGRALRLWTGSQARAAIVSGVVVALVIGTATVLIPNPVFGREIAPVWWNYPVWLVTSALSGMLIATYVRKRPGGAAATAADEEEPHPRAAGWGWPAASWPGSPSGARCATRSPCWRSATPVRSPGSPHCSPSSPLAP
ncbi:hypothetical protein [Tessaracoccus coleopterorum]|uniref:hypothetical protein n=1 Tax=Tessaracoccus coleopterorum TaxID=2714950 RepID=UPI0018D39C7A|nr:hypothetical protein [Tessaracoccus coleopterorum]